MMKTMIQIQDLAKEFHQNGYCVVKGVFDSTELQSIEDFFENYKTLGKRTFDDGQKGVTGAKTFNEVDPQSTQVRAMQLHRYESQVLSWMTHPHIAEMLSAFFGKPALGVQTMYYYKPPGARGQAMHQDNFYLLAKPATCAGAWTPIDDADDENGCLWVVPGSHQEAILCPQTAAKKDRFFGYGDGHIDRFAGKAVPVPVKRGETLFFSGNLIHGSGPNRTKNRSRRTFIGHYVDQATEEISKYYFPIYKMNGEIKTEVREYAGGGPCGDGWMGDTH